MVRPQRPRRLFFQPDIFYFKPQGVPLRFLQQVDLKPDEIEAIKLHNVDNLTHQQAAHAMAVSQPTFTRILNRANRKIAKALIYGYAIRIETKSTPP